MTISWKANVGVNYTPAYQVSGRPFVTGNVGDTVATKIEFPTVTRWIYVSNRSGDDIIFGFSKNGVDGDNYFTLATNSKSEVLELKVSEIWVSGSAGGIDIVAGLTSIPTDRVSLGTGKPSWSGSVGVG